MNTLKYRFTPIKTMVLVCMGLFLSSHAYSQCACKDNMTHMSNTSFTKMMVEDDSQHKNLA